MMLAHAPAKGTQTLIVFTRVKFDEWTISSVAENEVAFSSIERAADHLVRSYNISDDEIDAALYDMYAQGNNQIVFNEAGRFEKSRVTDDTKDGMADRRD